MGVILTKKRGNIQQTSTNSWREINPSPCSTPQQNLWEAEKGALPQPNYWPDPIETQYELAYYYFLEPKQKTD